MARLPRLIIAGLPHLVSLRAQDGQVMVLDDRDRRSLLGLLRDAAAQHRVAIHAYGFVDAHLDLVATPQDREGLSLMMQAVARRHAVAYNRRYGRRGGLWEGRFRAAVIDPEIWLLRCMVEVERAASGGGWASRMTGHAVAEQPGVVDPEGFWILGNTPFEREAAYRSMRERGLTSTELLQMEGALRGGWALGSEAFVSRLVARADRPARPRPRGRPRQTVRP
jgi:putative transposase